MKILIFWNCPKELFHSKYYTGRLYKQFWQKQWEIIHSRFRKTFRFIQLFLVQTFNARVEFSFGGNSHTQLAQFRCKSMFWNLSHIWFTLKQCYHGRLWKQFWYQWNQFVSIFWNLYSFCFFRAQIFSERLGFGFEEHQPNMSPPNHYAGRLQKHFWKKVKNIPFKIQKKFQVYRTFSGSNFLYSSKKKKFSENSSHTCLT